MEISDVVQTERKALDIDLLVTPEYCLRSVVSNEVVILDWDRLFFLSEWKKKGYSRSSAVVVPNND